MHTYSVPPPPSIDANSAYFSSALFDQDSSMLAPSPQYLQPRQQQQQQQYQQHQLTSYDLNNASEWCPPLHGLLTPPQFNISFPTTSNTYIQPPSSHHYQQQFYQYQDQQQQQQPLYQTQQYPSPPYYQSFIPSPPISNRRNSSICSLPSPVPISRSLAHNSSNLINMNYDQSSSSSSLPPLSSVRSVLPPSRSSNNTPVISKWVDNTAVSPKSSNSQGTKLAPRGSITFETTEKSCTPFISKLTYLLENPALFGEVIRWDPSGTSFLLTPSEQFTEEVLPNVFSHSSIPAFTRQLNTYNFTRISKTQLIQVFKPPLISAVPLKHISAWYHPNVTRANPSTLNLMSPKQTKTRYDNSGNAIVNNGNSNSKRNSFEMDSDFDFDRMRNSGEIPMKRKRISS